MKLNQLIAIANGEKSRKQSLLTKIYQNLKQNTLFEGIARRYNPVDDAGEKFPEENKLVQYTTGDAIAGAIEACAPMYNIVMSQDEANCRAVADIKIGTVVILEKVPVTSLLFLEKQLEDLNTFVTSLPVLDPAEKWEFDSTANYYKSAVTKTAKLKKVPKTFVKYAATKEHPAQVDVFNEDILVGLWDTTKFSGNMKRSDKERLINNIRELQQAVKIAREEANSIEVKVNYNPGNKILDFVFNLK